MNLNITIEKKKDLYYYVLNIMKMISPSFNLTEGEIKLLSFLYEIRSNLLENKLTEDEIGEILFSSTTRTNLMKELNISYNTYNNIISTLRNDKNLIKKKSLHPLFTSLTNFKLSDKEFNINLKLKVNELEKP